MPARWPPSRRQARPMCRARALGSCSCLFPHFGCPRRAGSLRPLLIAPDSAARRHGDFRCRLGLRMNALTRRFLTARHCVADIGCTKLSIGEGGRAAYQWSRAWRAGRAALAIATTRGSADVDQSPPIVSFAPNPLRLIAAMEEVLAASIVCCARSGFGINLRRCGGAPAHSDSVIEVARIGGAAMMIAVEAARLRAVCDEQRCGREETASAGDGPGLHE